ncbi:MAG TPA: hypothetical protein VND94_09850 [Terriglobia bacterium]|nr:hypothetical protein [Terriglobia bacterium]
MTMAATTDAHGRFEAEDVAHETDRFHDADAHGDADKDDDGQTRDRRAETEAEAAAARLEMRRQVMLQAAPSDDPWLRDRLAALSLTRLYDPLPSRLRIHLDKMQRLLQEGSALPDNLRHRSRYE